MEDRIDQLRSILKPSPSNPRQPASASTPNPSARDIAIHHATLLEHRKQLEAQILDSLILLSEYPLVRGPQYTSSDPAPSDAADFKAHVRLFQPSDYDDLVEERNVNGLCGYTLCPRPKRSTGPGGEWKLTSSGEIVRRRDLERWCSQQCARRALYVKVQLNETAAWERAGIPDIQIDLWGEDPAAATEAERAARQLGEARLEEQRRAAHDSAALATERGERGVARDIDGASIALREREVKPPPEMDAGTSTGTTGTGAPADDKMDHHLFIDGFKIKLPERRKPPSTM